MRSGRSSDSRASIVPKHSFPRARHAGPSRSLQYCRSQHSAAIVRRRRSPQTSGAVSASLARRVADEDAVPQNHGTNRGSEVMFQRRQHMC
jgi:hypothetical protein